MRKNLSSYDCKKNWDVVKDERGDKVWHNEERCNSMFSLKIEIYTKHRHIQIPYSPKSNTKGIHSRRKKSFSSNKNYKECKKNRNHKKSHQSIKSNIHFEPEIFFIILLKTKIIKSFLYTNIKS